MAALYDRLGHSYRVSRSADPWIAERIRQLMQCDPTGAYLDLGCGTGNYARALAVAGGRWTGLDVSPVMLSQARRHPSGVHWVLGDAAHLPFADGSFTGAFDAVAAKFSSDAGDYAFVVAT